MLSFISGLVIESLHVSKTLSKKEFGIGSLAGMIMLLVGKMWNLRLWIRKAAKIFKWSLWAI